MKSNKTLYYIYNNEAVIIDDLFYKAAFIFIIS